MPGTVVETVRRSVANNLNDIAKDHPGLAVALARRWHAHATDGARWVVRHGLRGLIKTGDAAALELLGFGPPDVEFVDFDVAPSRLQLGESLQLSMRLDVPREQGLIIDYAVHHGKADGSLRPKVFKWSTRRGACGRIALEKCHAIRPISTRRYYAGEHRVELLIDGQSFGLRSFELML